MLTLGHYPKAIYLQKKNKGADIAKTIKDVPKAIELGMSFEKDSVTFYEGMKKVVLEGEQKTIDGLIAEERTHLKRPTWEGRIGPLYQAGN